MNNREKRIYILDLQDHHTSRVHKYYIDDCKMGKVVYQLETGWIFDEKAAKRKIKLKWDY
ncbi:hypothetical protein [Bacillus cereus]|uniref:hypothetical protein n=1 Tax=Bacillus cereus TaxID=1396 RepID=UPI0020D2838E|nr:hypothetical protein [Bacillus cereus]